MNKRADLTVHTFDNRSEDTASLKNKDSDGTFDGMDPKDFHGRIARLEGGWTTMQWATGFVAAVLVGGLAILWNDVSRLEDKVDALPSEIRRELQDLNSSMIEAIQAARNENANRPAPAPQVIYLPPPSVPIAPPSP